MKKIALIVGLLVMVVIISGCKNVYKDAVRKSLESWKWWQEDHYIQDISTHELLAPYYIQGIPYVSAYVRVVNKYDPYRDQLFHFFVRKDYPSSRGIPQNKEWLDFIEDVYEGI